MIYCVSDLHGEFDLWFAMLRKINFSDCDTLYVLGDVADRGPEPMKLLIDMKARSNVIPLIGNHDITAYYALRYLSGKISEKNSKNLNSEVMVKVWLEDGGKPTLKAFGQLELEQQNEILNYLGEFSLYETVHAGGNDYVLVHGGLENFSEDRALEDYSLDEIIFIRTDYSKPLFSGNRYLVTGHTPTVYIKNHPNPGYIYRGNNHIAIDCGATFWGGRLGAICLDTGEEFYVEKDENNGLL